MSDLNRGAAYWILVNESDDVPHILDAPGATMLMMFPTLEFARSAAAQNERVTGEKLVPMEAGASAESFVELLRRLSRDHGVNAITLVRDGEPARTVSVADFVAFVASQRG